MQPLCNKAYRLELLPFAVLSVRSNGDVQNSYSPIITGSPLIAAHRSVNVLVVRFIKTMTNEIDGFFCQARRAAAAVLTYGKDGQRSMAKKDAISCQRFGETNY